MGSVSTLKKIALAARLVAGRVSRTRVGGAWLSGARVTAASFGRILHVLWLEVTGFIFLCLGMMGALAGVHEYHKSGMAPVNMNKVWMAGIFAGLFAYFGISSFWRARRKRV
jgi:hypothetical protein